MRMYESVLNDFKTGKKLDKYDYIDKRDDSDILNRL